MQGRVRGVTSRGGRHSGVRLSVDSASPEPVCRGVGIQLLPVSVRCLLPQNVGGASDYTITGEYHFNLQSYYAAVNGGVCQACQRGPLNVWDFDLSLDRVIDGTSTTILVVEAAGRPDLWMRGVKNARRRICHQDGLECRGAVVGPA